MARSVLDAWAILAFLWDEPAAARVEAAIERGAVCSWINLGEVLYKHARRLGWDRSAAAIDAFAANVTAEPADAEAVRAAAAIKAEGRLSYADCFAVATAERHAAPLLTGDPEILRLSRPALDTVDISRG